MGMIPASALNRSLTHTRLQQVFSIRISNPKEAAVENGSASTQANGNAQLTGIALTAKDQLKSLVERIERLEEEKAALAGDIRDLFAQAKSSGFDTKALRTVIRLRKQDANERRDHEALLATYMHALGMLEAD
jgi:uncharacterized protein (UPF0335 family)